MTEAEIFRDVDELSDGVLAELQIRFSYHAPTGTQPDRYQLIRKAGLSVATLLSRACPESRELRLALTHLEQVVMFANAAIARREVPVSVAKRAPSN